MSITAAVLVVLAALPPQAPVGSPPRPAFNYVGSTACGNVVAYSWTQNGTEQLAVQVDLKRLNIKVGESRRIALTTVDASALTVEVLVFDRSTAVTACTDVLSPLSLPEPHKVTWRARTGIVTVSLARLLKAEGQPSMYKATISLERMSFEGPDGQRVNAPRPILMIGEGGWIPG